MTSTTGVPSSTGVGGNSSTRDPMGFLTSPPSVVVKVVGTARDDINGLLGTVLNYNMERERYLVHMSTSQSIMALKKENITKASLIEKYRCHWQQLQNDPRVREKVAHYIRWCEQQVQPYKLWQVVGALVLFLGTMFYLFGFTRCLMMVSLIMLLLVIVMPDITAKTPWKVMMQRFPTRSRETLEQQLPFLKGKLSDRMALAAVMVIIAFSIQSLFVSRTMSSTPKVPSAPPIRPISTSTTSTTTEMDKKMMEKYYHLGFQDAMDGKDMGHSIQEELDKITQAEQLRSLLMQEATGTTDPLDGGDFDYYPPPQPARPKSTMSKLLNFSSVGSIYYIYRMLKEKGTDQSTNLFSMGQLAANLQHHTEWWQQAMLVFSVYNLIRILVSW
jgi:hypothetical protein